MSLLALVISCAKEVDASSAEKTGVETVMAVANDFVMAGTEGKTTITQSGAEAPKFSWKEGDVLGVIPMDDKTVQSNYTLSEIESDSRIAMFDGGVWSLREGKTYAAYYPFRRESADSKDVLCFTFDGQNQAADADLGHLGDYDYMYAATVVPVEGKVTFNFEHLGSLVRLLLNVPEAGKYTSLVLESSEKVFASSAKLSLSNGKLEADGLSDTFSIGLNSIGVEAGGTLDVWMEMFPGNRLSGKSVVVKLLGKDTFCYGSLNIAGSWEAGKAYSYPVTLKKGLRLMLDQAGATSSTLAFKWTINGVVEPSHEYSVALYSDSSCSHKIYSMDTDANAFNTDTGAGFTFSGLESGRTFYCRVLDKTTGLKSEVIPGRTEDFKTVRMPYSISGPGIVLAEDFGELRWDSDVHYQCAGVNPSSRSSFSNYNGQIKRCGSADSAPMDEDILYNLTSALPGSRLEKWASEGNVYVRPGMIELGKNKSGSAYYKGYLFTPEFTVPFGMTATVDVTITASSLSNTEEKAWVIGVMDRANANVSGYKTDFGHHPEGDAIRFFTFEKAGKWYKLEAKGLVIHEGDRIMFGPKASYKPSGAVTKTRAYVNDVTVNVTSLSSGEPYYGDPLMFNDGREVKTAADWASRRREILEIFQNEVYGRMPDAGNVYVEKVESGSTTIPANSVSGTSKSQSAVREQYRMWFRQDHTGPKIDWLVVRPADASGPVPVIMSLNYWGNHQMLSDPQIFVPTEDWFDNGDSDWGVSNNRISASSRGYLLGGARRYHYPLDFFISKGYAFVTACCADVAADPEANGDDVSLQQTLPFRQVFTLWGPRDNSKADNTGVLAAWGWALMRGMDMVEGIGALDASRVLVTGCSRLGKAALIAGAFDERFAVVCPVQTGGGGVPLSKHFCDGKESVESETRSYTHWWCSNFSKYAGNESAMTFDQHMLVSCIAPRAVFATGYQNPWFDKEGEFLSLKLASPVWTLLGKSGMPDVAFPAADSNSAIGDNMGYYHRGDKNHGVVMAEWNRFLNFADKLFFQEP